MSNRLIRCVFFRQPCLIKLTLLAQCICSYLRVGWVILLGREAPLSPTKEAGRGSELRGTADWLVLAFSGCGTKLLLGLRG